MHDVALPGLDGTNPLAFLAAMGTLQACDDATGGAQLRWTFSGGWHPVLTSALATLEQVVERLDADRRSCIGDPALALTYDGKADLKAAPSVFRAYLTGLAKAATQSRRRSVDWGAAFGSDVVQDRGGNTKPTALHFTAGQQQFLEMVNELCGHVTPDHLTEAVAGPWQYQAQLPVLGWDATAAREYALRADNPSTAEKPGVPGVDWLAVRGLALLPVAPVGLRLVTTGCRGGWKDGAFAWPLWNVSLPSAIVRSLLGLDVREMSLPERRARGVAVVHESAIHRNDQGGYGSMTPAVLV